MLGVLVCEEVGGCYCGAVEDGDGEDLNFGLRFGLGGHFGGMRG